MVQEQIRRRPAPTPEGDADAPMAQVTLQRDNTAVDALLDEIDDVLVTNAEQFVAGFVQKGGE